MRVVLKKSGNVVIEPSQSDEVDLDALIAGITDENRHDPVEMGPPAGMEVW